MEKKLYKVLVQVTNIEETYVFIDDPNRIDNRYIRDQVWIDSIVDDSNINIMTKQEIKSIEDVENEWKKAIPFGDNEYDLDIETLLTEGENGELMSEEERKVKYDDV